MSRSTNLHGRNDSMLFLIKKRLADAQYLISNFMIKIQKQPFADVLQNRCS